MPISTSNGDTFDPKILYTQSGILAATGPMGFFGNTLTALLAVQSGTGAPSANADFIGQEYIDSGGHWYKSIATGTGSSDWIQLG